MGVPIFFVLSGFLISYPFFRQRAADNKFWHLQGYARRRIGKIVPPYYLSIIVFAAYYFLRFSDTAYLQTALQWALGIPNFLPVSLRFNGSYWSLIIEVHFYIVLPILFLLTRGLNLRHTAMCLFVILFAAPLIVRQFTWPEHVTKYSIGFLMARFPCQLDFFAWGILFSGIFVSLSAVRDKIRALSLFGYVGLVLLMASLVFWMLLSRSFDMALHPTRWSVETFHLLPGASAFFLLFFTFDARCIGTRILAHPWLRFVGIVSYEWFLFHEPVVYLFKDIFGHTRGSLIMYALKTILPLAMTFGVAVLVYRFFSLPLMNRIRGR